jgi:hypothetical protein
VLRAAADHRGAAFIEIYQNCPIFNDDAFAPVTDAASRDDRLIRLEHGEPVRFGADQSKGLRFGEYGALEAVDAAGADSASLLVHDKHVPDPSYAFALSRLGHGGLPRTPDRDFPPGAEVVHDDLMAGQIEGRAAAQRPGDLAALLAGGDTLAGRLRPRPRARCPALPPLSSWRHAWPFGWSTTGRSPWSYWTARSGVTRSTGPPRRRAGRRVPRF